MMLVVVMTRRSLDLKYTRFLCADLAGYSDSASVVPIQYGVDKEPR